MQIATTLIPIFLLISMGYIFKRFSFPSLDFWPMMDRFTYYILFPSLLVYKLSIANLSEINELDIVLIGSFTLIILLVLTLIFGYIKRIEAKAFTSVIQGAIRFNTYIFLSIVDAILGDKGLVIAAVIMTFLIPLVNFLCISSFAFFVNKNDLNVIKFTKTIFQNPLIVACIIGGILNIGGIELPAIIASTIAILGSAALPMGLLSVGVGLDLSHIKSAKYELFLSTFLKLVVFPIVIYVMAQFFPISKETLVVLTIYAATPTASSAYILARQLGGDLKLMSSIVTFQTLASIVTIAIAIKIIHI